MVELSTPRIGLLSSQESLFRELNEILANQSLEVIFLRSIDQWQHPSLPLLFIVHDAERRVFLDVLERRTNGAVPVLLLVDDFKSFEPPNNRIPLDACPFIPGLIQSRVQAHLDHAAREAMLNAKASKLEEIQERLENEIRWHRETERILSENERTLRRIFHSIEATGEAILITEKSNVVYYVNPAFCKLTGYTEADVFGCQADDYFSFSDGHLTLDEMKQVARENGAWRGDVSLKKKDGGIYQAYLDLTSVSGMNGEFEGFIFIQRDISALKKVMAELERLARIDALTGLYNRRYFLERFEAELERARRYGHPTSLLLLDLDHFKQINDRFGHGAGDEVLERAGLIINNHMRSMDLGGRYGGEEFIIALPETPLEGAVIFADRLRCKLADVVFKRGEDRFQVTCSIGVGALNAAERVVNNHIKRIDEALYRAKDAGRNRIETADP